MRSSKFMGLGYTLLILAFWATMNTALIRRELEYRDLSAYRQGMVDYLGQELRRERWLGIYATDTHEKIGYTGFTFEKVFDDDGIEHHASIDSYVVRDLFGKGTTLRIRGEVISDNKMLPISLDVDIEIDRARFELIGKRKDDGFEVSFVTGGAELFSLPLPLREFFPSDGFFPTLPISGFEVGDTFDVPMFDPIFREVSEASVEVMQKTTTKELGDPTFRGLNLECFVLETRFRGMAYESVVTPDGELLMQSIPAYKVKLKREERAFVRQGVRKPPEELKAPKDG